MARPLIISLALLVAVVGCSGDDDAEQDGAVTVVDQSTGPDTVGADEPFGRVCDNLGQACPDEDLFGFDLFCIGVAGGAPNTGFCSRVCSDVGTECDGVPNGQRAACLVEENVGDAGPGTKYCAFLCQSKEGNWTCPGTLKCGKPNAQGIAICLP